MSNKREIKITTNKEKILEILERFEITENFDIILELPESKELYKTLSTDPSIIDWDYIYSDEEENINNEDNNYNDTNITRIPEKKPYTPPVTTIKELVGEVENKFGIDTFNNMSTLVEAIWNLSKKSPGIIYGSNLFWELLEPLYNEVGNTPVTINHAMLCKIIEAYYYPSSVSEAYDDTMAKLKENWKLISTYNTIVEVATKLYKHSN